MRGLLLKLQSFKKVKLIFGHPVYDVHQKLKINSLPKCEINVADTKTGKKESKNLKIIMNND